MKKVLFISLCFFLGIYFVNALDIASPNEKEDVVKETVSSFLDSLNQGEDMVYTYLDSTSDELSLEVQKNLGKMSIHYQIKNIKEIEEGHYKVNTVIEANGFDHGFSWEVHGLSAYFEIQEMSGKYVLTKSNLFEKVGSKAVLKLIGKIFAILGCIFLGIVLTILFIVRRRNKKIKRS